MKLQRKSADLRNRIWQIHGIVRKIQLFFAKPRMIGAIHSANTASNPKSDLEDERVWVRIRVSHEQQMEK